MLVIWFSSCLLQSKWLVFALFSTIILWRHNAESLWAAMGSIINAMLSVILKRILNHERPVSTLRSDPGMPSSHAQSIFFMVVFAILSSNYSLSFVLTSPNVNSTPLLEHFPWLAVPTAKFQSEVWCQLPTFFLIHPKIDFLLFSFTPFAVFEWLGVNGLTVTLDLLVLAMGTYFVSICFCIFIS